MNTPAKNSADFESCRQSAEPRRFQFRRRTLFCLTAAAAIVAGVVAIRREAEPWRKVRWWEGRLAGQSRSAVEKKLGPPEDEWNGHYGNPDIRFVKLHPVVKTLIFPQSGGKLYVSFEPKGSQWIAFGCSFLPDGAAFSSFAPTTFTNWNDLGLAIVAFCRSLAAKGVARSERYHSSRLPGRAQTWHHRIPNVRSA